MTPEQKQLIREKFSRQFVELHPIDGTDLFNRPPLYDTPQEQIDKIIDFWLNEIDLAIKQTEERIVEKIEDGFSSFTLKDWSGETEVYDEMDRLKESIINLIKNNEIQSN